MIADDDKNAFCLIEAFVVDNAAAAFLRRDRAYAFPAKGNRDMMMAVG